MFTAGICKSKKPPEATVWTFFFLMNLFLLNYLPHFTVLPNLLMRQFEHPMATKCELRLEFEKRNPRELVHGWWQKGVFTWKDVDASLHNQTGNDAAALRTSTLLLLWADETPFAAWLYLMVFGSSCLLRGATRQRTSSTVGRFACQANDWWVNCIVLCKKRGCSRQEAVICRVLI